MLVISQSNDLKYSKITFIKHTFAIFLVFSTSILWMIVIFVLLTPLIANNNFGGSDQINSYLLSK